MSCGKKPSDMVGWEDFLIYVKGVLPNVPDEMAAFHLREAAIEFAEETHAMTYTVKLNAQQDVYDYKLALPDNYRPHVVLQVCVDGDCLPSLSDLPCDADRVWCHGYFYDPPSQLYIFPAFGGGAEDAAVSVDVAVVPSRRSCYVPESFFERYAAAIGDGALASLMLVPKSDWYDKSLAGVYYRKFRNGKNKKKILIQKNHNAGPLMMRAPRFV